MEPGEYKKILLQVFDALSLSEDEKKKMLELFKKKLVNELLYSILDELPEDEREWVKSQKTDVAEDDPRLLELRRRS